MFQYAFGRNLAIKNKTVLLLDINDFNKNIDKNRTPRNYELSVFTIGAQFASKNIITRFILNNNNLFSRVKVKLYSLLFNYEYKNHVSFDSHSINNLNKIRNIYLNGYFQSENYFIENENTIREDFTFKKDISDENLYLLKLIKKHESISIHIRRGDYISNKSTNKTHGVCSLEYYKKAVEYISEKVHNPFFFIFSDDVEWVTKNLKIPYQNKIVTANIKTNNYNDMRLMSGCKHNIIANSSFSWWGAWLNKNPDKIVIAPKKWFADSKRETIGLIPNSWLKI